MSLTTDYKHLAAIAPGKTKRRRKKPRLQRKAREAENAPKFGFQNTPSVYQVPEGVRRYFLSVPEYRIACAVKAGCQYDRKHQRWYIDNPKSLAEFASWKPTRVGFDQLVRKLKRAHHAAPTSSGGLARSPTDGPAGDPGTSA